MKRPDPILLACTCGQLEIMSPSPMVVTVVSGLYRLDYRAGVHCTECDAIPERVPSSPEAAR